MRLIDSHTGGEPTRVIVEGGPSLGEGTLAERADRLAREHGHLRGMLLGEPRGFDAMVGALLCEPDDPDCAAGVIFFNNAGNLGMCGHGTIGTAVTLCHLGRIEPGMHRLQTPVGAVLVNLRNANQASVENVESFRHLKDVSLEVPGIGAVTGDVAWGGNWFFLTGDAPFPLEPGEIPALTRAANDIRRALAARGITGTDGAEVDHVEFFGKGGAGADSRNFVLCPGGAFDRSPCGTGTSAKLACLAEDGLLASGERWVQESIIDSRYEASYRPGASGGVIATITGSAHICAETTIHRDPADPFANGIEALNAVAGGVSA